MNANSNGQHAGAESPPDANDAIAMLRTKPRNVLLFRGFGPLVAGIVLFLLMLWLAPSVAPEHIVQRPVNATTTTTRVAN
jgi:hypothetical protein